MGGKRWLRCCALLCISLLVVVTLPGCSDSVPSERAAHVNADTTAESDDHVLAVDSGRQSDEVIASGGAGAPYNYAPTAMLDGGRTRMWWCSQDSDAQPPGDDILYAESDSVDGPFSANDGGRSEAVLSGNQGQFDGMHTCDPSVIRVDGTYYLYYTGAADDHELGNAIGLATSTDGRHWARANDGRPILNPAHDGHRPNSYGAGQPAAVYLDGWFYLMFTDTTGRAAGDNGAGQFIVRSKDPAFAEGIEALGTRGFAPVPNSATARTNSLVDAFSADLMWVEALDAFAIAHETRDGTTITFWNRDFTANPHRPVLIQGPWQEGPGLVRQPDGHAPISQREPCDRVPLDVFRATGFGAGGAPSDVRHFGVDVYGTNSCADPQRVLTVLDGSAVPAQENAMDLVTNGAVLRVQRRSVAAAVADRVFDHRPLALDRFPITARLPERTVAVSRSGRMTGFVLDDGRLWPVRDPAVAELNESPVQQVDKQQWDAYPVGSTLGG